jgi:hypothetical protein
MKKKDAAMSKLAEHSQETSIPHSAPASIAPILTTHIAATHVPKEAEIRELAFYLYQQRGCRDGHDVEDWLEAEGIIPSQPKQAA